LNIFKVQYQWKVWKYFVAHGAALKENQAKESSAPGIGPADK